MTTTKKPHEILIPIVDETAPLDLFNGDRLKLEIDQLAEEIGSLVLDPANPADYKQYGSIKRKIGSFGAAVDRAGKSIVDPMNKEIKVFNSLRATAKARIADIKDAFTAPCVAYDAEVAQHVKAVSGAFELMQNGHHRVGEFRSATLVEWDALLKAIAEVNLLESFFGDRLPEARELKSNALEMNEARRAKFIEDEAALEAGRIALKVKEDAEAAERHQNRQKPPATAVNSAPVTTEPQRSQATVHREILRALVDVVGISDSTAKEIITAIVRGEISQLKVVY